MTHDFDFFFFNDTATTEIYTLSLHDALPISRASSAARCRFVPELALLAVVMAASVSMAVAQSRVSVGTKRSESTRLNSSHLVISYAVFCLKKKTKNSG